MHPLYSFHLARMALKWLLLLLNSTSTTALQQLYSCWQHFNLSGAYCLPAKLKCCNPLCVCFFQFLKELTISIGRVSEEFFNLYLQL